ncbi:MAG: polyprenyl synthetase family protein [Herpetosiphonaceae bacterium]|nr:polyprenyl synthetase family protein [Herpetosiphonaceae bacterium]
MQQAVITTNLLPDLQAIDEHIVWKLQTNSTLINVAGRYLLASGGKRIRASLAVLSAQLGKKYRLENVLHAAAAVELIHAASLVHDDLIDDAETRRGRTTVHTKWSGNVALMLGDYLFAMAAGEMALAPDARVISIFADAVQRICEAELAPVQDVQPTDMVLNQYYAKIGGKTAALFEAAARAGLICGSGDDRAVAEIGQFGYDIGLAFQIVDDVLDFTGDELTLGKPAGHDLTEGTITLPLIYAVQDGGGAILHEVVHTDGPTAKLVATAVAEVRRMHGPERAVQEAERLVAQANERLEYFEDGPAKAALLDLAAFALRRAM